MTRIRETFERLEGRAALIPFIVAGDPTYEESMNAIRASLEAGADAIEIGLPYSDPLADGPVIQASALRSLQGGFRLPDAFRMVRDIREWSHKPLIAFTYVNPILQYGIDRFFAEFSESGGDGVIIPDVPLEETPEIREIANKYNVSLIPLVSPTSGEERIAAICKHAQGFVYCVSSLGVTGERQALSADVRSLVERVKRHTALPACVGFGVSTAEHARELAAYANGVIVGSAFVRRIEQAHGKTASSIADEVARFTAELKEACR